ncbi:hypothetical protein LBMAG42_52990 [Deltaproteobacteria bacterium]|nr:hypothetical protein LBMAG42_52990 [Deltaproteobacteria bacterium]
MKRALDVLAGWAPRLFPPLVWSVAAVASFAFAAVLLVPGRNTLAELLSLLTMLVAIGVATYAYLVVLAPATLRLLFRARSSEDPEAGRPDPLDAPHMDPGLARYFSPQVAKLILERGPDALVTAKREVTVLFADLSGFTRFSEVATAEETVSTLTHYLDELVRVAHSNDGTIDKFMGDEVMVLFGAPIPTEDHASRAVKCARDMQVVVGLLNAERARRKLPTLGLTIGVNSGECVVGHVGGEARVQFSAIGDAVNVGKRIQGLAARGEIVIGERTLELAGLPLDKVEEHFVKGRGQAVKMLRISTSEGPTRIV